MVRLFPLLLACLATLTFLAPTSRAQAPKVGDWYEDSTDLGFKIKTPKDWEFIPSQPDERYVVGKYDPKTLKYVQLGRDWDSTLFLHTWIVKLDNRVKPEEEKEDDGPIRIIGGKKLETIEDWLDDNVGKLKKDEEKSRTISKTPATEYEFVGKEGDEEYRVYVMAYELEPGLTVAFVANGPGDHKKWKKYSTTYQRIGKSFQRVEVERVEVSHEGMDTSSALRSQKRAKLQDEVSRTPGWELYETDNYFIISNNDDKEFIEELMERLEAIREQYELYYPPEQAEKLRARAAEEAKKKEEEGGDEDGDGPVIDLDDILNRRTSSGGADPMELAKCSVVRVCKDQAQYHSYGGPGGSAGYWASFHEELVIYDDKKGGGRRDTWAVLNHEAFHQYIFYFYGSLAPHSWYNEGTGDFYSGFQLKGSRFRLKPFDWREGLIQENLKAGRYAPLKDIVRWTQGEYYGGNELGLGGGENYAQGWSMIYFFRTGPKKCRDWNPAWNGILDTYLETLAFTGDLDAAIDAAFADVDWEELEEAWKKYTLSL